MRATATSPRRCRACISSSPRSRRSCRRSRTPATILRLLARSATGQEITTYTTFATGPRREGDPDGPSRLSCRAARQWTERDARQRVRRHAALYPLRRLPQSLPGLWRDRRPCLRLGLSRTDGRGADAAAQGIDHARDLPNASSFCGRCEEVCPMDIPLPDMMRAWRERDFARGKRRPASSGWC